MVRINLLPVREIRRRVKAKGEVIIFAVCLVCLLGLLALVSVQQSGKSDGLQEDLAVVQQKIALHQKILARMEKLEADKALLETQIGIIDKLKVESSLTVRVLDEVARIIPSQRMWLSSLGQQGSSLKLTGMALDNRTIAGFMEDLKQSPYVKSVALANASLKAYAGRDLKSFSLSSSVGMPDKEEITEPKQ